MTLEEYRAANPPPRWEDFGGDALAFSEAVTDYTSQMYGSVDPEAQQELEQHWAQNRVDQQNRREEEADWYNPFDDPGGAFQGAEPGVLGIGAETEPANPDPSGGKYNQGRDALMRDNFAYGGSADGLEEYRRGLETTYSGYGRALHEQGDEYAGVLADMGGGAYGLGQALTNRGAAAMNGQAGRFNDAGSLDAARGAAGNIGSTGDWLFDQAQREAGPSVAEAQLMQGAAMTANQNMSLARSGRGMGGSAAAQRAAMQNNAQVMGQTNAQLSVLRAQETNAHRQQQIGAAQAAGQMYGAAAGAQSDINQSQASQRAAEEAAATARGSAMMSAGATATGQGLQGAQAAGSMRLGATQAAAGIEQQGQALAGQANQAALAGSMGYESNQLSRRGQDMGAQTAADQLQAQREGALLGMLGTGTAAAAKASDRRAKEDIEPVDGRIDPLLGPMSGYYQPSAASEGAAAGASAGEREKLRLAETEKADAARAEKRGEAFGALMSGTREAGNAFPATSNPFSGYFQEQPKPRAQLDLPSDRTAKTDIRRVDDSVLAPERPEPGTQAADFASRLAALRAPEAPDRAPGGSMPAPRQAAETVRETPAYSFRYRDPERHGEGQRLGVMAQDLEKTPAGRRVVGRSPDGTRMVDTGELSTINTAAIHNEQQRIDDLEEEFRRLRESLPTARAPDLDALDDAHRRERAYR